MKTFTFAEHVKRTVIRTRHAFKAMWRVCRRGRFLVLKPWRAPSSRFNAGDGPPLLTGVGLLQGRNN